MQEMMFRRIRGGRFLFFIGLAFLTQTPVIGSGEPSPAGGMEFITARDGEFLRNGRPFRFVGFNTRGICPYGYGDILPYSFSSHRTEALDWVEGIGGKVIRVFAACHVADATETGDRLRALLDQARYRDISVIVCLTDFYSTGMCPQGDGGYYVNAGTYWILGPAFFAGGYEVNYLPQAVYLAERFKDNPAVFAWEVGNELRNDWDRTAYVDFCLDVSEEIRAVDPNHMVTTGIQGTNILGISYQEKVRLYSGFDFLTIHNYHGSDWENDVPLAQALNKPIIVEEAGFQDGDRPVQTDGDIGKWMDRGVSGYMQWGFMASAYDNGDGDRLVGMDMALHTDWYEYVAVYQKWAGLLKTEIWSMPNLMVR